ncbi:protein S40-5 [Oryza sativa Japonica Group]|uniref:Os07g0516300 protein n=3 Tax=Oryza TaxID=4527 RepID=Q0D627_ORYSJ|nr:eukaryotic translation initiation factor 4B1 [Oryza sativa Japonica Group]XP_052161492.1 eukaryotic translation initiation factor 4B1-like [Oryza glaberrima]KAF2923053.1 hypothetical protein DAI22_07g161800 [Oryza sativa Japonica Group]BAC84252.1 unknown protein [Oryza sativa Japonica Group]BAF21696.1 Os07g0516300 [Oryza sativa Japonica Group]BAG91494.1 unnamed protein product [Oryza sativa Japonica Group]BAG95691.1 unnamed protein product [Oryza sativa Japonica Group]|eukprot:NP_001059782.1 Os07g0516300 [Oryza sativa Japonica Group]
MAKARKQQPQGPFAGGAAAGERSFLGFQYHHHHRGGSVAPAYGDDDDLPDLAEADVWYAPSSEGGADHRGGGGGGGGGGGLEIGGGGWGGGKHKVGGLSRAFADGRQVAASAPVQVPAWPGRYADPDQAAFAEEEKRREEEDDAGDGDGDGWVPPHVYLARRQARSSVVEGVGRTLKGRDASRVRDAVWSRTGFDG